VPGEIVTIYATGVGAYTPGTSGIPATGPEPLVYLLPPAVSLGGTSCTLLYAGPAPGYVGLDQINCRTSKQISGGLQPLQIISPMAPFESGTPTFVTNSNIVSLPVR
jgi:uncharacterized protein (TIGR03437 family)